MENKLSWNGLTKEQYLAYLVTEGYTSDEIEQCMEEEFSELEIKIELEDVDEDEVEENQDDVFEMTDKEFYNYTGDSKFYGQKIF